MIVGLRAVEACGWLSKAKIICDRVGTFWLLGHDRYGIGSLGGFGVDTLDLSLDLEGLWSHKS